MKKIRFTRLIFYAFKTKSPLNNSHPLDNFWTDEKQNYMTKKIFFDHSVSHQ